MYFNNTNPLGNRTLTHELENLCSSSATDWQVLGQLFNFDLLICLEHNF